MLIQFAEGTHRGLYFALPTQLTSNRIHERVEVSAPVDYPLLSFVRENGRVDARSCATPSEAHRDVAARCRPDTDPQLLEEICYRAQVGGCVLLIKNTVGEAQAAFRALQSARREGGPEIGLLHSRFPQSRREEQETLWMNRLGKPKAGVQRPNGCVLVATQVVEQSVDIDADLLITDLAPTDMLLQRIGRLWRHPRVNRPLDRAEDYELAFTRGLRDAYPRGDGPEVKDHLALFTHGVVDQWSFPKKTGRDYVEQMTAEAREEKEDSRGADQGPVGPKAAG